MKDIVREMWSAIPMKVRYVGFFIAGAGMVGMAWLSSCSAVRSYPQDNPVEEFVERVIENETGLDLDLSPFSSEEK